MKQKSREETTVEILRVEEKTVKKEGLHIKKSEHEEKSSSPWRCCMKNKNMKLKNMPVWEKLHAR